MNQSSMNVNLYQHTQIAVCVCGGGGGVKKLASLFMNVVNIVYDIVYGQHCA